MKSTSKKKRAINFDLHGESLERYYSKRNANDAYRVLGKFFHDNGFEHRQGSGYVSKEPLTQAEVFRIAKKLDIQFPWLEKCTSCMDVTDIGETYDMKEMFKKRKTVSSMKMHDKEVHKDVPTKADSLSDRIKNAKQRADQRNEMRSGKAITKSKNHKQEL